MGVSRGFGPDHDGRRRDGKDGVKISYYGNRESSIAYHVRCIVTLVRAMTKKKKEKRKQEKKRGKFIKCFPHEKVKEFADEDLVLFLSFDVSHILQIMTRQKCISHLFLMFS